MEDSGDEVNDQIRKQLDFDNELKIQREKVKKMEAFLNNNKEHFDEISLEESKRLIHVNKIPKIALKEADIQNSAPQNKDRNEAQL